MGFLRKKIRISGGFGKSSNNQGVRLKQDSDKWGSICLICKEGKETQYHFLFVCTGFREQVDLPVSSLTSKVVHINPMDGSHISDFLVNLD